MTDRNQATILLEEHLKELGLHFEAEYQFCKDRRWRADFAIFGHADGCVVLVELREPYGGKVDTRAARDSSRT